MKDPKQVDAQIERVFAALRDAEAPDGLEARVLRAVDARSGASTDRGSTGWRPVLGWMSGVGIAAAAAVLLALVMARANPSAVQHAARTHHTVADPEPNVQRTAALTRNSSMLIAPEREGDPLRHRATLAHTSYRPGARDVAEEEARAPSMLAPPMPLTASEALLQQSARRGHSNANSPLSSEVRARERLEAALEFTDFFTAPPVPGGNE